MRTAIIIALCAVNALAGSTGVVWRGASGITDFRETLEQSVYRSAVLWMPMNANPAGYATWAVEDGSAARNNGTQATTNSRPSWMSGYTNGFGLLSFDGTNDFVELPSPPGDIFNGSSSFSVLMWVNSPAYPASGGVRTMVLWSPRGQRDVFVRYLYDGASIKQLQFGYYDTSSKICTYNNPANSTWYHLCGVYDQPASRYRLYVNGVEVSTIASGTPAARADKNTIGTQYFSGTGNNYWLGKIDLVLVFSSAVPSNAVMASYLAQKGSHP